jgi:hypothetical protein
MLGMSFDRLQKLRIVPGPELVEGREEQPIERAPRLAA